MLAARGGAAAWRIAPVAILALATVVDLWNLTVSGWANAYYAAAAQAASQSWSAMFFGAIDAAGFITVDKPPASLWLMGLSVRLLGLSPIAVLLPEALCGVAAVLLLWDAVRRQLGREAALIAGVAFALTPAAVLMFRFDNPDALLTLLLVAAAWALVRGLPGGLRWPLLAAVLIGMAFLTKYLQAYLVLPAFALTWIVAAPGSVARRLAVLAASAVTVAAASFWWVAVVDLIPAWQRPYIGGSADNSALDLVLGYDGLGRLLGRDSGLAGAGGPGGGPGAAGSFGGLPGPFRLLNDEWAGQIAWLLPAAVVGLGAGLVSRWRAGRTDPRRAAFLLWGTWAAVHLVVFSFMGGIVHPYYAVALAPALAALTGGGLIELSRAMSRTAWAAAGLGAVVVGTAVLAWQLLERTPTFWPGVGLAGVAVAVAVAILFVASAIADERPAQAIGRIALAAGVVVMLIAPALYSAETAGRAISGGDPSPGPAIGFGGGGAAAGSAAAGGVAGLRAFGSFGGGAFPGDGGGTTDALVAWLVAHRGSATWLVAATTANQAASLQIASGVPVMAMGGFMGIDPAPTLEQLQAAVHDGRLRYVLIGGGPGGGPAGGPAAFFGGVGRTGVGSTRTRWVTDTCRPVDAVSASLYDCAGAA